MSAWALSWLASWGSSWGAIALPGGGADWTPTWNAKKRSWWEPRQDEVKDQARLAVAARERVVFRAGPVPAPATVPRQTTCRDVATFHLAASLHSPHHVDMAAILAEDAEIFRLLGL